MNPGLKFDAKRYLEMNPDVAKDGMNPLIHYLKFGEPEGRPFPSGSERIAPSPEKRSTIVHELEQRRPKDSPRFSLKFRRQRKKAWLRHQDFQDQGNRLALECCGSIVGYCDPSLGQEGIDGLQPVTQAFCEIVGGNASAAFSGNTLDHSSQENLLEPSERLDELVERLEFPFGREFDLFGIEDIWFANDWELRVRVTGSRYDQIVRYFQLGETGTLELLAESYCYPGQLQFNDVPLRSRLAPVLVSVTTMSGALTALSIIPFPSLSRNGLHYCELLANDSDEAYAAALSSYSEILCKEISKKRVDSKSYHIAAISVDPSNAKGFEPIFCRDVIEWIGRFAGVRVGISYRSEEKSTFRFSHIQDDLEQQCRSHWDDVPGESQTKQSELLIGADSLPTIMSMCSTGFMPFGSETCPISYLVGCSRTLHPKWKLVVPASDAAIVPRSQVENFPKVFPEVVSLRGSGPGRTTLSADFPLVIRFSDASFLDESRILYPVSADTSETSLHQTSSDEFGKITVCIPLTKSDLAYLPALLTSLRTQVGSFEFDWKFIPLDEQVNLSDIKEYLAQAGFARSRAEMISGRNRTDWSMIAAETRTSEFILFSSASSVFYDERTLAKLLQNGKTERVATSGCMTAYEGKDSKGKTVIEGRGPLLVRVELDRYWTEWLKPTEVHEVFALSTFPVLANPGAAVLIDAAALRQVAGRSKCTIDSGGFLAALGMLFTELGFVNLYTSLVSVGNRERPAEEDIVSDSFSVENVSQLCVLEAIK
jgi:hypothetical protein